MLKKQDHKSKNMTKIVYRTFLLLFVQIKIIYSGICFCLWCNILHGPGGRRECGYFWPLSLAHGPRARYRQKNVTKIQRRNSLPLFIGVNCFADIGHHRFCQRTQNSYKLLLVQQMSSSCAPNVGRLEERFTDIEQGQLINKTIANV